jgi:hypothetical protein
MCEAISMSMAMTTQKVVTDGAGQDLSEWTSSTEAAGPPQRRRETWRWSLVRLTPTGADVLLRGSRSHPDEASCQREVNELVDVCADCMMSIQHPDGSWFWIIYGSGGEPIAHSGRFDTAAASARALYRLRHELTSGVDVVLHDDRPPREHMPPIEGTRR